MGQGLLVVIDKKGALVGLISEEDLEISTGRRAAAIMTVSPPSVDRKTKFASAVTMMQDRHLSCLPVLENGRICGVLTNDELVIALQCTLQMLQEINDEHRKILLGTLSASSSREAAR